jgi:hypothetical protein
VSVKLTIPKPWIAQATSLPEMSSSSDGVWRATRKVEGETWRMEVRWVHQRSGFLCRIGTSTKVEDFPEVHLFDYPHEVLIWMTGWFRHLAQEVELSEPEEENVEESNEVEELEGVSS